ncbi:MAG TPA: sialidase family protein [Anaerolineales bacterium]|nr:sialidase family protein [Anaerolineales bacterium]
MKVLSASRSVRVLLFVLFVVGLAALVMPYTEFYREWRFEGKAKIREGGVRMEVVNSSPENRITVAPAAPGGFTPQTRVGFFVDNEWEPAIASDRFGHVYILYPQYGGVPGCDTCYSPTMILQMSSDHGQTFASPQVIYPEGSTSYQVDAQIAIDPIDGRTVYAAWLQNNKSDILVGKSTDFGATWTFVLADHTNAGTDKPILAVRGQDVYVSYNHSQTAFVTFSHDGGATFTEVKMNQNAKLGWSLGGGGTVTPNGSIYFSWDGYEQNGGAKGNVNLYISKSTDQGATWTTKLLDVSTSPPDCSAFGCGWAFLGAAIAMTSDSSGNLYALWNAGSTPKGPERIYFSKSTDGGNTWSAKKDVSTAPQGTHHNFPAISAAGSGDVRISWMDARAANGGMDRWNVYFRSSTNGGSTWSNEVDLSTYVAGPTLASYIFADGFRFPFGDYFEMDVDEQGTNHLVWGEGYSYDSPGSIWYARGK